MKQTVRAIIILALVFGTIDNLYAQLEGKRISFYPQKKPNFSEQSRNPSATSCGLDTILYPYLKELVFAVPNDSFLIDAMVGNVRTASQAYVLNQNVKIHGVQFWGYAYSSNPNYQQTLQVRVYLYAVDGQNMPTTKIDSATVTINHNADFYEAIFTNPVSYSQNFAVAVKSVPNDTLAVITNNAGNVWNTNYGEGLAWRRFGSGTWNTTLSFFGADLEYMIFPIVSYEVNTGFTSSSPNGACEGATLSFTNNSSNIFGNRMFNLKAFDVYWKFAQADSSFNWNYGDSPGWTSSMNGSHLFSAGGTYNVQLAGEVMGYYTSCQDTMSMSVVIQSAYNESISKAICEGESYVFGSQTLTQAGVYTEVFKSKLGCDSTVTLTLGVNPKYTLAAAKSICQGESYVFGSQTLTQAGVYTEVFKSKPGCDSTVTLTLTVNPKYTSNDSKIICFGESYVFGTQLLTQPGTYTEVFKSTQGCDSTVTLNLGVTTLNFTVALSGGTLTASITEATYQWLDCNNGYKVIAGATLRSFTPSVSGNYGVEVTKTNCTDTSDCVQVITTDIKEAGSQTVEVAIYPNPTNGSISINCGSLIPDQISITNTLGKVVKEVRPKAAITTVDLAELKNSFYFINVRYKQSIRVLKVMKR